jgi:transposase
MITLADRLLPDQLWQRLQPLLPPPPSRARGGAPRTVSDRACMAAIIFMARTSTPWALLPVGEFGCGSVTTCWRRVCRVGPRRGVRAAPGGPAGRVGRGRRTGLVADQRGLLQPAGGQGGTRWAQSGRPSQARVQAAPGRWGHGAAAVAAGDRGQHQRQPGVRGAAGRPPAGANAAGPTSATRTRPTTIAAAAAISPAEGSRSASPAVGWSHRRGWAATGGKWNARSLGWPGAGGCASATTGIPGGSSRSPCWPATGCATTGCPARPPPGYHDPGSDLACPPQTPRSVIER